MITNKLDRSMIPKSAFSNVKNPNKVYTFPSYTYDLIVPEERIIGHTDHVDSVAQASDLVLHIERFSTDIYSDRYGIQINDLYGKKTSYVKAKLEYRILDALSVDDRVLDVYDYKSEILDHGRKIKVSFTVESNEGTFDYQTVLDLFAGIDINFDEEEFEESFYYTYDEDGNPILVDKETEEDDNGEGAEEDRKEQIEEINEPVRKVQIQPFSLDNTKQTQSYLQRASDRLNNLNLNVNKSFFNLINSERTALY